MFERVARTKTEPTAWLLIELLTKELPYMGFVVVKRTPDSGCEVVPVTPVHPLDAEIIRTKVAGFVQRLSPNPAPSSA